MAHLLNTSKLIIVTIDFVLGGFVGVDGLEAYFVKCFGKRFAEL